MPEALLTVLKIALIILIWLFFLRVLRAVWVDMKQPARVVETSHGAEVAGKTSRRHHEARRKPELFLRIIDPPERRNKTFELEDELTIGRAPACGVVLENDSFVSKVHARVFRRNGKLLVEDLGSTNGTFVNSGKVAGAVELQTGDRLQVGQTILEVTK